MSVIGIGRHDVRVVSHALGKSSTGTPHIAVLFENEAGDRITWYGYLSDRALEYTLKDLQTLGWDPHADNGMIDALNGTSALVDNMVSIVVESEVYENKPRMKVKWINDLGGMAQALPDDEAGSFAASLRAKIMSAPKVVPNKRPGAAKTPAPATVPDDDDMGLPF